MALIEASPVLKFLGVIDGIPELKFPRSRFFLRRWLPIYKYKNSGSYERFCLTDVIYHTRATCEKLEPINGCVGRLQFLGASKFWVNDVHLNSLTKILPELDSVTELHIRRTLLLEMLEVEVVQGMPGFAGKFHSPLLVEDGDGQQVVEIVLCGLRQAQEDGGSDETVRDPRDAASLHLHDECLLGLLLQHPGCLGGSHELPDVGEGDARGQYS